MNARCQTIRDYIFEKGEVTVEQLCALFPERSAMTIRRDLTYLERNHQIIRVHGGARANPAGIGALEDFYSDREAVNMPQKQLIAQKAAQFVEERRAIFIDSGTTLMAFARMLPEVALTVLTSGPNTALELVRRKPAISVILSGGALNPKTLSCSGYGAIPALEGINIDTAFFGTSGFSFSGGFTSGDFQECQFKHHIIKKARRVFVLMDSTKLNINMPYSFATIEEVDTLITDSGLDPAVRDQMREQGLKII